jgi:proline dehydrogenase
MMPLRYKPSTMRSRSYRLVTHPDTARYFESRATSNEALTSASSVKQSQAFRDVDRKALPCLSVMPTRILVRTLFVTSVLSSPRLVSISLPIMKAFANPGSWLSNTNQNLILHWVVRKLIYDHFCAGENDVEVRKTIEMTKAMGYEGVILGYAREIVVNKNTAGTDAVRPRQAESEDEAVWGWRGGNLRTLSMLGPGDFLAVK